MKERNTCSQKFSLCHTLFLVCWWSNWRGYFYTMRYRPVKILHEKVIFLWFSEGEGWTEFWQSGNTRLFKYHFDAVAINIASELSFLSHLLALFILLLMNNWKKRLKYWHSCEGWYKCCRTKRITTSAEFTVPVPYSCLCSLAYTQQFLAHSCQVWRHTRSRMMQNFKFIVPTCYVFRSFISSGVIKLVYQPIHAHTNPWGRLK